MLKDRLIVSLPLLVLVVAALVFPGWTGGTIFLLLVTVFAIAGCLEFFRLSAAAGLKGHTVVTLSYGCAYLLLAACNPRADAGPETFALAMFVGLCLALCLKGGTPSAASLRRAWVSMAGFMYLFWSLSFVVRLYFLGDDGSGRFLLLYLLVVTKATDTGAYTLGTITARSARGNRKLVPTISPKKSWEGLLGGVVFGVIVSLLMIWGLGDRMVLSGRHVLGVGTGIAFGVAAALLGLLGDLAESAFKRAARAKDSGSLAGVGGVLDILDSLIPATPLFFAYVSLFLRA